MYGVCCIMLRINIYVPEDLNKRLAFVARKRRKAKAEVIREVLVQGLELEEKSALKLGLSELVRLAEQIPVKRGVPNDVSVNHDYYAWGGEKRK